MVNELVKLTDKALEAKKNYKWKTNLASFKPAFANTYKVVMTNCHCGRKEKKKQKSHPTPEPCNLAVKSIMCILKCHHAIKKAPANSTRQM